MESAVEPVPLGEFVRAKARPITTSMFNLMLLTLCGVGLRSLRKPVGDFLGRDRQYDLIGRPREYVGGDCN